MEKLLNSIELSLETENWYSAIFMALSVPDICAALESDDGKTSKQKYIQWFDEHLSQTYKKEIGVRKEVHTYLMTQLLQYILALSEHPLLNRKFFHFV